MVFLGRKIHYAWVICIVCFVIMIFTAPLVNACASLYLTAVTEEFGISRSAFTMTNTIVALCGMILSPFWGQIYQRYNAKYVLSTALLGFGLGYMSYSFAHSLVGLYFSATIVGIFFSGSAFLPVSMLITSWFDAKRGLAMSISLGGIGIGGAVLSPLITQMILRYGWRDTYQIVGVVVIVVAVPIAFGLLKSSPKNLNMRPLREKDTKKKATQRKQQSDESGVNIQEAKRKSYFYVHLIGMLLLGLICSAPLRQISPYVEDLHGPATAALIVSMYSFIGIFGKLLLGVMNDKFGSMKGAVFAFGLMIVGFLALLFGEFVPILYIASLFYGVGNGVGTVSAPLIISATFGKKNFNFMRGLTQSPMQLGMSLGGLMLAFTYDMTGSYRVGWTLCIGLTILSAGCFAYAYQMSKKERS